MWRDVPIPHHSLAPWVTPARRGWGAGAPCLIMPPLPASPPPHPNGGFQPPPVTLSRVSTWRVLTPKPGTVTEQVWGLGCEATGIRGAGGRLHPPAQHPAPCARPDVRHPALAWRPGRGGGKSTCGSRR